MSSDPAMRDTRFFHGEAYVAAVSQGESLLVSPHSRGDGDTEVQNSGGQSVLPLFCKEAGSNDAEQLGERLSALLDAETNRWGIVQPDNLVRLRTVELCLTLKGDLDPPEVQEAYERGVRDAARHIVPMVMEFVPVEQRPEFRRLLHTSISDVTKIGPMGAMKSGRKPSTKQRAYVRYQLELTQRAESPAPAVPTDPGGEPKISPD